MELIVSDSDTQAIDPRDEPISLPELSIASPVFNEEEVIEQVVSSWVKVVEELGVSAEIVLCNDGSTDATGEILERLQPQLPQLRVVGGTTNRGYGHALSTAISHCTGRFITTIDSDGQFDLADIGEFLALAKAESLDAVTGRRVRKQDSLARVLADRCLNLLVRMLFGTRLHDTNCALKLVRREHLQRLVLEARGFPMPTEICLRLEAAGARIGEVAVQHLERDAGQSKLKIWRTGWHTLLFLLYLRARMTLSNAGVLRQPERSPQ